MVVFLKEQAIRNLSTIPHEVHIAAHTDIHSNSDVQLLAFTLSQRAWWQILAVRLFFLRRLIKTKTFVRLNIFLLHRRGIS